MRAVSISKVRDQCEIGGIKALSRVGKGVFHVLDN